MTRLASVEHVSPKTVKVTFSGPMRNDDELREPTNYEVPGSTVTAVEIEYASQQPYVSATELGGAPWSVYLMLDANPYTASPIAVGLTALAYASLITDFAGAFLTNGPTLNLTACLEVPPAYWEQDGLRTKETFYEFSRLGRVRATEDQPNNYATAHLIGKVNDLMSGAVLGYLADAIPGDDAPEYLDSFGPGGFGEEDAGLPGIGQVYAFKDGVVPCHVDKLWGPSDGQNRLFRATTAFHAHGCIVLVSRGPTMSLDDGVLDAVRWYAPQAGRERQIVLRTAPPAGATVLAVYVPRRSLIKIGREILAYDDLDLVTGEFTIYGRRQLCSALEAHAVGDAVEDVWGASFVQRAEYSLTAFGASGRALEYIAMDSGTPRSDVPSLCDTDLRRVVFHTSRGMLGTPGSVSEALRYLYPRIWSHMIVAEDPRWPKCLAIWYSSDKEIGTGWPTDPAVEPWEHWLDELSWPDGFASEILTETYYRDDGVDPGWYGDYWLADSTTDPVLWPYPIVVAGPPIHEIGVPLDFIPPPIEHDGVIDFSYFSYVVRPAALDRVLPIGCGVLLLDYAKL